MKTEKEIREFKEQIEQKKNFCLKQIESGPELVRDIYEISINHCDSVLELLNWVLEE